MIYSYQAEKNLLYVIIDSPGVISEVLSIIEIEMFYNINYKLIFQSLIKMYEDNINIDIITIENYLKVNKIIEDKNLKEFIAEYYVYFNRNYLEYCSIIYDKYIKRKLLDISEVVSNYCKNDTKESEEILQFAQNEFSKIKIYAPPQESNTEALNTYIDKLLSGEIKNIPTGFYKLDNLMNGFAYGEYIILAAKPKIGKTTLILNTIYNQAFFMKIPVKFYSLEMKKEAVLLKIMARVIKANPKWITEGTLNNDKYLQQQKFLQELDSVPLNIVDDMFDMNKIVNDIKNSAEKLIYIDYNELIDVPDKKTLYDKLVNISQTFTILAKNTGKAIIMIQQLRDDYGEKKPTSNNLYMKVGVKDASKILLLHGSQFTSYREIILSENRFGQVGFIDMELDGVHSIFKEY
jgi:replicative DNA helicase